MKKLWNWLRTRSARQREARELARQGPTTLLMQDSRLMQDSELLGGPLDEALVQREAAGGLDFVSAIRAHQAWKGRLLAVVEGRSPEPLDPREVCRDDLCVLGQWLYGSGSRQYGGEPLLPVVMQAHREFHQQACQVLRAAQDGHLPLARQMLATDYHRASVRVQGKLAELFMRLQPEQALAVSPGGWLDTHSPGGRPAEPS